MTQESSFRLTTKLSATQKCLHSLSAQCMFCYIHKVMNNCVLFCNSHHGLMFFKYIIAIATQVLYICDANTAFLQLYPEFG